MLWLKNLITILILTLFAGRIQDPQDKPSPIGMILQVKGEVHIKRAQEQRAARLADVLYSEDQLVVSSGEAVFIFCPSNQKISLKERTTVQLSADGAKVLRGPAPMREKLARCSLPRVALGVESLERVGGLRARGYPPISLYLGGPITSNRPVFEWAPVPSAESFHLTLKNDRGVLLWEHTTSSVRIAYPESIPPLEQKSYQWEIRAESGGRFIAQQAANFEVQLTAELSNQVPKELPGKLVYATELENAGFYAEAAACYREIRAADPEDMRLTRHLAWLYWNAGLIAAANEERKKFEAPPPR